MAANTRRPKSLAELPPFVVEEYRRLKDSILVARDGTRQSVLLISALAGEGTSTVAAYLALVAAQDMGRRVLLVDANLRSPAVHQILDLDRPPGLTELLTGTCTLAEAVKKTETQNLFAITAGGGQGIPLGILNLDALPGLIEEMKERWDFVIWDSAPAVPYSDGLLLASRVNGIVLVVSWGKTPRESVLRAKRHLQDAGGHFLGVTLNRERA